MKRCQLEPVYWLSQIQLEWREIVGDRVAEKAVPTRFRSKVLTIHAANPTWMNELQMMKPIIMDKLRSCLKDLPLENIRFICS